MTEEVIDSTLILKVLARPSYFNFPYTYKSVRVYSLSSRFLFIYNSIYDLLCHPTEIGYMGHFINKAQGGKNTEWMMQSQ